MNQVFKILNVPISALLISACTLNDIDRVPAAYQLATAANNQAEISTGVLQCKQGLALAESTSIAGLDSTAIELLNWNIKKGEFSNWRQDFELLISNKDLVLMQEATLSMQSAGVLKGTGFWSFAPGYTTSDVVTGVATLSQTEPLSRCHLTAFEPWFGTPKATNITQYALSGSDKTLVVVNTHMINFTFGLKGFRAQLAAVSEVLSAHRGPIILSGDFNTWRPARYRVLNDLLSDLNIEAVEFKDDHRVRFFGSVVDHVFVGGLHVRNASTHRVESSDHNPMSISLSLEP